MPMFDDTVSNDLALEDALLKLADQFGPNAFARHIQSLAPSSGKTSTIASEDILISDAASHYLSSDTFLTLAATSQTSYRYEMGLFLRYCEQVIGMNTTFKDVDSAIFLDDYLGSAKKLNTRSKKAAFLRSFLGEVCAHFQNRDIGKLKRILSLGIDPNREPRAFKKEQLDELICQVRLGRESHRNFTILWTFLGSGIRLSELIHLQVRDIVSSRQEIHVRGKGQRGFKQPSKITKSSLAILNAYVNFRYSGIKSEPNYSERYIFSDDKGISPLHESTVQKMFASLVDSAKTISETEKQAYQLTIHSLRHSFALFMLQSGVDIHTIKKLMRHKWYSSTEIYLNLFDSMLVEAIDKHPLSQLKTSDLFS
ncbi:tyrosine-type recombinase/integrase [Paenibacillus agaridevorans]|uniref:tyrosine-type recombinase/integrase n=1 Tax=Paenibacillus agaridevorans TaxID=171404 RepID=UPI001BE489F3|nr:tyrosine-type recombinase/integrase [Paenibacillus agaridevorans]